MKWRVGNIAFFFFLVSLEGAFALSSSLMLLCYLKILSTLLSLTLLLILWQAVLGSPLLSGNCTLDLLTTGFTWPHHKRPFAFDVPGYFWWHENNWSRLRKIIFRLQKVCFPSFPLPFFFLPHMPGLGMGFASFCGIFSALHTVLFRMWWKRIPSGLFLSDLVTSLGNLILFWGCIWWVYIRA